jgi:hypothetical protein
MKRWIQLALLASLVLGAVAFAGRRHDPLTQDEIDQLREVAQEPEKRLPLLADFARLRLTEIEESRTPKKPDAENPKSLHDLLEDFLAVYDELDENVSMYEDRQADLRRALKAVIAADNEFHARLEGLQHNLTAEERTECNFVMSSIVDAVTTGAIEHRKLLAEQNAAAGNKKKK